MTAATPPPGQAAPRPGRAATTTRAVLAALMVAGLLAAGVWALRRTATAHTPDDLSRRLAAVQAERPADDVAPCLDARPGRLPAPTDASAAAASLGGAAATARPLLLLALGQSNAGNHGLAAAVAAAAPAPRIRLIVQTGCAQAADPLPGATGAGASIWSRLPDALAEATGAPLPVALALLAVDATAIDDWTRANSPLAARLDGLLADLRARGLQPDLVLWQQGEADARRTHTTAAAYAEGLLRLVARLQAGGVMAPVLVAEATVCRETPALAAVRDGRALAAAREPRLRPGPDLDQAIPAAARPDGCHLDAPALHRAAALWAAAIVREHAAPRAPHPLTPHRTAS